MPAKGHALEVQVNEIVGIMVNVSSGPDKVRKIRYVFSESELYLL